MKTRFSKARFLAPVLIRHFFRQPGNLISLVGILAGVLFLAMSDLGQPAEIRAAVCTDESVFAKSVYELLSDGDFMIQFYLCENEEQMKRDVASQKAECGYVLDRDIERELQNGSLEDVIDSYRSPGTLVKGIADEVVFSAVLSVYSPEVYAEYMSDALIDKEAGRQEIARAALREYESHRNNGSTFQFRFSGGMEQDREPLDQTVQAYRLSRISFLRLRGLIAVMILAGSLCAVAAFKKDDACHRFLWAGNRLSIEAASYIIAIAIFCAAGLAGLFLTAEWCGILKELRAMFLYAVVLLIFCLFISHLLKTESWVITFFPFAAAGSLVLAPVFVDLSQFSPLIGLLKWATPVSAYLSLF